MLLIRKIENTGLQVQELLSGLIRKSFSDVAQRFALTGENCPKHPSNYSPEWIEADFRRGVQYFVLYDDNAPAGCVGIEIVSDEICYMERLSVLPENRGNSLGKQLVQHALNFAAAKKICKIGIGIIAEQSELKAWYQQFGFVETGVKVFPHLPFSVCFMELELPSREVFSGEKQL